MYKTKSWRKNMPDSAFPRTLRNEVELVPLACEDGEGLAYGIPPPEMSNPSHYLQMKTSQILIQYTQPDTRRS